MSKKITKVTNVAEDGAIVGIQSGDDRTATGRGQVTNVARGGAVVGIQGGNVTGSTVVVNGSTITVTYD